MHVHYTNPILGNTAITDSFPLEKWFPINVFQMPVYWLLFLFSCQLEETKFYLFTKAQTVNIFSFCIYNNISEISR